MRSWSGAGTLPTPCCTSRPTPGIAGSSPFGCPGSTRVCSACSSACSGAGGRWPRSAPPRWRRPCWRTASRWSASSGALPSRFGATVRYYVAAAGLLPVGAALGTALARGLGDPVHEQVILAHVSLNVLGWIGLTIVGTLVTLWPTMLRTRIAAGSERAARRALPILVLAIGTTSGCARPHRLPGRLGGRGTSIRHDGSD